MQRFDTVFFLIVKNKPCAIVNREDIILKLLSEGGRVVFVLFCFLKIKELMYHKIDVNGSPVDRHFKSLFKIVFHCLQDPK